MAVCRQASLASAGQVSIYLSIYGGNRRLPFFLEQTTLARCGAVRCGALRCAALRRASLRYGALWCGTVRYGAAGYSTLWLRVWYSGVDEWYMYDAIWCGTVDEGIYKRGGGQG